MKKVLFGLLTIVMAGFALPVQAIFLTSYDLVGALDGSNTNTTLGFSNITTGGETDMATPISVEDARMNLHRVGQDVYYTTEAGIVKQHLGSATSTLIKNGQDYALIDGHRQYLLVNNGFADRPFLFSVTSRHVVSITPRMKAVVHGEFSDNLDQAVILANNARGTLKIFLSRSNFATYAQFSLPPAARSCSEVALSPSGTMISAICIVDGTSRVFVAAVTNHQLGSWHRKTIGTFDPHTMRWTSDNRLVAAGWDYGFDTDTIYAPAWYQYIVDGSAKFKSADFLNFTYSAKQVFGETSTVILTPVQILSGDRTGFYYTLSYLGGDSADTTKSYFGTMVGYYSFLTTTNTVLKDNGEWHVLATAPNYSL